MPPQTSDTTATASASVSNEIKAPACRTEILLRLWTHAGEGKKLLSDEASAIRQGAIAFIEDVINSRKGRVGSTEDGMFVSVLGNPADALLVSRRILLGMRGFRDKLGNHPVSVSISMDSNLQNAGPDNSLPQSVPEHSETDPAPSDQASHELSTLIRISRPAQILLTHDLFQQVSAFKGLPLKPFQGRFGAVEYLWTSEEKVLEFQAQQSGFVDSMELDKVQLASPQLETPNSPSTEIETYFEPRAKTPFGSEETQTPGWKKALRTPRAVATVAIIVMAFVIAGGVAIRTRKAAPLAQSKQVNPVSSSASQPPKTSPAPPRTQAGTEHQSLTQTTTEIGAKTKPAHADRPSKSEATTEVGAAASTLASPKRQCMLTGDLQRFVRVAEGYRGEGHYTDAKRLFTEVLDCDPNNQDARRGLERTRAAEAASPE